MLVDEQPEERKWEMNNSIDPGVLPNKYPEASHSQNVDICLGLKGFLVPLPASLESSPEEE